MPGSAAPRRAIDPARRPRPAHEGRSPGTSVSRADDGRRAAFARLALRDAAIVALVALSWWGLAALSAGDGPAADLSGLVAGLGFGAAAYLFHEWAHIAGAAGARSVIHPGPGLRSLSNFRFDTERNSRAQFLWMSLGGFVATGLSLVAAYVLLPDAWLASRVARGAVSFLALLGVVLELPLVIYSLATNKLPPLEAPAARDRESGA